MPRMKIYLAIQLALLLVMSVTPLVAWRRVRAERLRWEAEVKAFSAQIDQKSAATRELLEKLEKLQRQPYADYTVIHEPPAGCPAGWKAMAALFREKDGGRLPGCIDSARLGAGDIRIDELRAGEKAQLPFQLPAAPSPAPREMGPHA